MKMKDSCLFASFYEAIKHKLDDQSIQILRWRSVELLSPHLVYWFMCCCQKRAAVWPKNDEKLVLSKGQFLMVVCGLWRNGLKTKVDDLICKNMGIIQTVLPLF